MSGAVAGDPGVGFLVGSRRRQVPADRVTAPIGSPGCLLGLAVAGGVPLAHACGGQARCGTCRVEVLEGWECLRSAGDEERRLLGELCPPWRLACRAILEGEARVLVRIPGELEVEGLVRGAEAGTGREPR